MRSDRPGLEQCADTPHDRLTAELTGLQDSLAALQAKLEEAQAARARLVTARAALQQDIRVKKTSLSIDNGKCMAARISYPHNQRFMATTATIPHYTLSQPGSYNR